MRRRMVCNGFGNSQKEILDNKGVIPLDLHNEAVKLFFYNEGTVDFKKTSECVMVGIEPTYQYDKLKIITIHRDKGLSCIERGYAWGSYGSRITSSTKKYKDYTYNCKFTRFVDKWHKHYFKKDNHEN